MAGAIHTTIDLPAKTGRIIPFRKEALKRGRTTPLRKPNAALRTREHLTKHEVERLIEVARSNRHGLRDSTAIMICYRHGLRASELCNLRWDQIDFRSGNLHVTRKKNGTPSTHPLGGTELRLLRQLRRKQDPASPFCFTSERRGPFTTEGLARMVQRAGIAAGLTIKVHIHMLRHACGFALANAGHDTRSLQAFLGHRNIQNTVKYTALSPNRFKDFWTD
jgi:integrase